MPRLAHLSDIHFGGENVAAVAAARVWIESGGIDLIVITGDITSFGQPAEFSAAADWTAGLTEPLLITPGNHDTPYLGVWERLTDPFGRYRRAFGQVDAARWSSPEVTAATINTARGVQVRLNWSKGEIRARQADAALRLLADRSPGSLGVVACHHPLVEMVGGPMTARVRGGERAVRKLCGGDVDLILTGHIHAPFAMALPYGDGQTYAVGASTLSLRERGAPAGFNVIEADATTISVTAMAWTGSNFEIWRTWALPRRA